MAFLTDTNVWQEEGLRRLIDLTLYSDQIFRSHEIGMVKIDDECFPYVAGKLGVKPKEVLLVDDSAEKVEMAEKHGLRTIHFKSAEQVLDYFARNSWV